MTGKSESEVAQLCLTATPWTAAHQAPPSMGFSRQEYWSGVPLPSPDSAFRTVTNLTSPPSAWASVSLGSDADETGGQKPRVPNPWGSL